MPLALRSPAFGANQPIPRKYTEDGDNVSPPLRWWGTPAGTRSFALVMDDPDAPSGTFRHWGLYNIVSTRNLLPEGIGRGDKAGDLGFGINDLDDARYRGPAPPPGGGPHRYRFRLLALDVDGLSQAPQMPVDDIWKAAEGHIIAQAELVGTYGR